MTKSTGQRRPHLKNVPLQDPAIKRFGEWPEINRQFYVQFRRWLKDGGYGHSSLTTYGAAARAALGFLDKPYWTIDPDDDIQRVRDHLATRPLTHETQRLYNNGLDKLAQYLRQRFRRPAPERLINWNYYLGVLPEWLAQAVPAYLTHRRRAWPPDFQQHYVLGTLGRLTVSLRWMATHQTLTSFASITPAIWDEYLEARLATSVQTVTTNSELRVLQSFLLYLNGEGHAICSRMLAVEPLDEARRLPRDAPLEHLSRVWQLIEREATAPHGLTRRLGIMDRAWFLLMVQSGLRTGEVRRLKQGDIDWENRRVRIEQSKGLKDRIVPLSPATLNAIKAYLEVRGPADALPENVFISKHQSLGPRYCQIRLRKYCKRCGIWLTPHQLRHSCATLLLNAGAPILTVQMILGHRHINTTLGYARLYDGTVAADYYRAMGQIEKRLFLPENSTATPPSLGELVALVDSLRGGTLNEIQAETVQVLHARGCWRGRNRPTALLPRQTGRNADRMSLSLCGPPAGQGKERGRVRRPCPAVWPPVRRSGCSPAEPYPPRGQE